MCHLISILKRATKVIHICNLEKRDLSEDCFCHGGYLSHNLHVYFKMVDNENVLTFETFVAKPLKIPKNWNGRKLKQSFVVSQEIFGGDLWRTTAIYGVFVLGPTGHVSDEVWVRLAKKSYFICLKRKSTVSSINNLKKVQSSRNWVEKDQTLRLAESLRSWILGILGFCWRKNTGN